MPRWLRCLSTCLHTNSRNPSQHVLHHLIDLHVADFKIGPPGGCRRRQPRAKRCLWLTSRRRRSRCRPALRRSNVHRRADAVGRRYSAKYRTRSRVWARCLPMHRDIAASTRAAHAELVFEHSSRMWGIAATVGNPRNDAARSGTSSVWQNHAMLVSDECAPPGLGERSRREKQQRGKGRRKWDLSGGEDARHRVARGVMGKVSGRNR